MRYRADLGVRAGSHSTLLMRSLACQGRLRASNQQIGALQLPLACRSRAAMPFQSRTVYLVMYFVNNWLSMVPAFFSGLFPNTYRAESLWQGLWNATTRIARLSNTVLMSCAVLQLPLEAMLLANCNAMGYVTDP